MDPIVIMLFGMAVVVGGILWLRLHAFLALLAGALLVGALTPPRAVERWAVSSKKSPAEAARLAEQSAAERVAVGFGSTCGQIGILIALAAIIGKCLLDSGAADKIVRSAMRLLGEQRAPWAFAGAGYTLGIPVFFDTVFYLLIPLGKALAARTKRDYLLYVLTIICGATMTHSLVPPTPGPLFVADKLGVNLGVMMIGGMIVSAAAAVVGLGFACWVNRRVTLPLRPTADISLAELENLSRRDERELPPLWLSLTPILLPVALIGGDAFVTSYFSGLEPHFLPLWAAATQAALATLGDKNLAVGLAAVIALATLAWQRRHAWKSLPETIESALASGGTIILITAAGGAFGTVLQQTGIAGRIATLAVAYHLAVIPLAFFITALVRIAQGSATVAMITAAGIVGGMATADQLGFHPLYVALAIGCGSKLIPWMNDSGFWVVCKMSGLTEKEALTTYSVMLTLMGFAGLAATVALAKLVPLV